MYNILDYNFFVMRKTPATMSWIMMIMNMTLTSIMKISTTEFLCGKEYQR